MAFVRTKIIQGKTYAYLVENKWTEKGSRQSSKKYLGRVFSLQKVRDFSVKSVETRSGKNKTRKDLLADAVFLTLCDFGFSLSKNKLKHKNLIVDLENLTVSQKNGKPVSIAINEGILCTETLYRILNCEESEENSEGYVLAKYCVEAGLSVPQQLFVELYEKTLKKEPLSGA